MPNKGKGDVTATVEWLGPAEAEVLLGMNVHNRHVRETRVHTYARALRNNQWVLNGETIKVSKTNKLLDGQHRLLAIVETGKGGWFVVVRGLDDAVQETIDVGEKRSLGDILHLRGEKNALVLAACVTTSWRLSHDTMGRSDIWPSTQELLKHFEENPGMRQSIPVASRAQSNYLRYPPSQAAALHYEMTKLDADLADRFWDELFAGDKSSSAITRLRDILLKDVTSVRRLNVSYRIAITIKAWNSIRQGKTIPLKMTAREPFPDLV